MIKNNDPIAPQALPGTALGLSIETLASDAQLPAGRIISGANGAYPLSAADQKEYAVIEGRECIHLLASLENQSTPKLFGMSAALHKQFEVPVQLLKVTPTILSNIYAGLNSGAPKASERTPVENLIHKILSASVAHKQFQASDIHIESRVRSARVFFRINRRRYHHLDLTHAEVISLGQVMYGYCEAGTKATTWNTATRNDGAFEWTVEDGRTFYFRFSSSPIHPSKGVHIVLRVLSMGDQGIDLTALGYSDRHLADIENMTATNSGLMLFGGATNSGKSTSIQASLRDVFKRLGDSIKVITVEDPVEYVIEQACQVPATRRKLADGTWDNSAFTDAILGALRQDPDIMMVGEVRDENSAAVVKDFVLAGRFMLSTLHVYSFMGVFRRLLEIKVPWEVVTMDGFWAGIVYQRLVGVLCDQCSIPWADKPSTLSPHFIKRVENSVETEFLSKIRLQGAGCDKCRKTGVTGSTLCAETWLPSEDFMTMLAAGKDREARAVWIKEGGIPIMQHALSKMKTGAVSPLDIEQNIGRLPSLTYLESHHDHA